MNWFKRGFRHLLDIAILRLTTGVQVQTRKLSHTSVRQLSEVDGLEPTEDYKGEELLVLKSLAVYRMFLASCSDMLVKATTGKDRFLAPNTKDFRVVDLAVVEFVTGMLHETFKSPHLSGLSTDMTTLNRALSLKPDLVDETLSDLRQSQALNSFWPVSKKLFERIGDKDDVPAQVGMATFLGESAFAFLNFMVAPILKCSTEDLHAIIMSEPPAGGCR